MLRSKSNHTLRARVSPGRKVTPIQTRLMQGWKMRVLSPRMEKRIRCCRLRYSRRTMSQMLIVLRRITLRSIGVRHLVLDQPFSELTRRVIMMILRMER